MKTTFLVLTILVAQMLVACETETVTVSGLNGVSTMGLASGSPHIILSDATLGDSSFDLWSRVNAAYSGNAFNDDDDSLSLDLRKNTA